MLHRKDVVFSKPSILQPGIAAYAAAHSTPPSDIVSHVHQQTLERCPQWADIATSPLQASFLAMLVSLFRVRRILEIGTFTGHATVAMAERLPGDGAIITLDNFVADATARDIALSAFARSQHAHKIQCIEGNAADTLETLSGPFDLIFVDADKPSYLSYYTSILDRGLLEVGGLLIFDNTLWGGHVLSPGAGPLAFEEADSGTSWLDGMLSDWARHVVEFNRHIAEDDRVETVVLTVHDGMTLVRRVR